MLAWVVPRGAEDAAARSRDSVHASWHLLGNRDSISHVNHTDVDLPLPLPALKVTNDKMR